MQRKTIARVGDALIHGEDPYQDGVDSKKLDVWVDKKRAKGASRLFGERCGPVIGISVKRESIAWVISEVEGVVAEGAIDVPVLPLGGEPVSMDQLREHVKAVFEELSAKLTSPKVAAVGVAWPGLLRRKGVARDYPRQSSLLSGPGDRSNPPLEGIFRKVLKEVELSPAGNAKLGERPPIVFINDANADLLYESRRGVAKGAAHVLGLKVSGGLGMGILFNRQLVTGSTLSAGDIEHFKVRVGAGDELKSRWGKLKSLEELDECGCTGSECVGRFASGAAIVEQLGGYFPTPPDNEKELTPNERARRIEDNATKPFVTDVCGRAGKLLGQALLGPALAFDPEMIVVSAFPRNEDLLTGIQDVLVKGTPLQVKRKKIRLSTPGFETTAAGAAQFALETELVPRIERDLGAKGVARYELPPSLRMQLPATKQKFSTLNTTQFRRLPAAKLSKPAVEAPLAPKGRGFSVRRRDRVPQMLRMRNKHQKSPLFRLFRQVVQRCIWTLR